MHWNHRVMKRVEHGEEFVAVVEVFYTDDDAAIMGWTQKEAVWGENIEELRGSLDLMIKALDTPVLDEADLLQRMEELEALGADVDVVGIEERIL